MDLDLLLIRLALAAYLGGVFLSFLAALLRRPVWMRAVPPLGFVGCILQLGAFLRLWWVTGSLPLDHTPERILLLAWSAVVVYLLATYIYRLEVLSFIILPLAVVLMFVSNFLPRNVIRIPEAMQPGLLWLHIGVAILGTAALFLAFGSSVLYLIQERGLKSKRPPGLLLRLPSLQRCDSVGHLALLWGFPLLTLAIISGSIWSANTRALFWTNLPRESFSLLSWMILAIILYARLVTGWRGRKAAYLTILAFTAILARMLGFTLPS